MTSFMQNLKWRLPLRSLVSLAGILGIGVAGGIGFKEGPVTWWKLGAECVMYFSLMVAVWSWSPLRRVFRGAPRLYTIVLASVVVLSIASQIIGRTTKTYPFTHWTMYSDRSSGAVIFDFKAIHSSGKQTDFLPVTGFLPPRVFNNTLQYLLEKELGSVPKKSRWPHLLETNYRDVCERVAKLAPGTKSDPVVRVEAWRCHVKADTAHPENTIQRELVHKLNLNGKSQ